MSYYHKFFILFLIFVQEKERDASRSSGSPLWQALLGCMVQFVQAEKLYMNLSFLVTKGFLRKEVCDNSLASYFMVIKKFMVSMCICVFVHLYSFVSIYILLMDMYMHGDTAHKVIQVYHLTKPRQLQRHQIVGTLTEWESCPLIAIACYII